MTFDQINAASKLIEIDGIGAFNTVASRYGREAALLLVTSHLRRGLGSMNSFPPDPSIDNRVREALEAYSVDLQ